MCKHTYITLPGIHVKGKNTISFKEICKMKISVNIFLVNNYDIVYFTFYYLNEKTF